MIKSSRETIVNISKDSLRSLHRVRAINTTPHHTLVRSLARLRGPFVRSLQTIEFHNAAGNAARIVVLHPTRPSKVQQHLFSDLIQVLARLLLLSIIELLPTHSLTRCRRCPPPHTPAAPTGS